MTINWASITTEVLVETQVQLQADMLVKHMPETTPSQKTMKKVAREAHVKRLRAEAKKARK